MIRIATTIISALFLTAFSASATDFFGAEICKGSTDTRVKIPIESSLILEDVEIGDHGGLVMLLKARSGNVMDHVDDLMTGLTGRRGEGGGDSLQWSDGQLTGLAQKTAKKFVILAVTSTDECSGTGGNPTPDDTPVTAAAAPVAAIEPESTAAQSPVAAPHLLPDPVVPAAASTAATVVDSSPSPPSAPVAPIVADPDFEVVGTIIHTAADETWVDVMGSIVNHTDTRYKVATFDLGFYSEEGDLICVDTISVNVFKPGQERGFRDAIRCPNYDPETVDEIRLHFAGGF